MAISTLNCVTVLCYSPTFPFAAVQPAAVFVPSLMPDNHFFVWPFFLNFGHMFGKPYLYPQLCWILGLWIDQVIIKVCNLGDLWWKWKDNDFGPLTLLYPSISFSWITSVPFPMFLSLCPRLIDLTVRQCLVSLNWTGNGMWCPPSFLLFRTLSYPFDQPKDVVSLKRQDSTLLLTGNWCSLVQSGLQWGRIICWVRHKNCKT